jgi:pimeloyl-ACP methyl ester carboxylesterase
MRELSDEVECVAIDLPGHGRTPFTGSTYDVETLVPWLLAAVERERPTAIVGHSMGGILSLALAGHELPDVEAVGIIGLPVYASPFEGRELLGQRGFAIRSFLRWHRVSHCGCIVACRTRRAWQGWATRRWPYQPRGVVRAVVDHRLAAHSQALDRIIFAGRVPELAASATMPIAVLHGEMDRAAPVEPLRQVAERWGWDLTIERDANHQVPEERPLFTAAWIRSRVLAMNPAGAAEGLQAAGG